VEALLRVLIFGFGLLVFLTALAAHAQEDPFAPLNPQTTEAAQIPTTTPPAQPLPASRTPKTYNPMVPLLPELLPPEKRGPITEAKPSRQAAPHSTPAASRPTAQAPPVAIASADRFNAEFSSDAVRLQLANFGERYIGELFYAKTNQTYPVTGTVAGDMFTGSFSANGAPFPFTFQLSADAQSGNFHSANFEGQLVRH
jgi:hypothetical protein